MTYRSQIDFGMRLLIFFLTAEALCLASLAARFEIAIILVFVMFMITMSALLYLTEFNAKYTIEADRLCAALAIITNTKPSYKQIGTVKRAKRVVVPCVFA